MDADTCPSTKMPKHLRFKPGEPPEEPFIPDIDSPEDLETSYLTEDGFLSPHFNVHETHVVEDVQVDLDTPCWSPSDGSNTDAGEGFEFIEDFPRAAGTPQAGMRKNTTFEKIRIENEQAQKSHWNPFNDQNEWELARWLMTTGVSQNNREAFLKLPIVSTYRQTHK